MIRLVTLLVTLAVASSASAQTFVAERAPEWDALFDRNHGWTGGDGIFSIPLSGIDAPGSLEPDAHTMFIFSDSAIGHVRPDGSRRNGTALVNNTMAMLVGREPLNGRIGFGWRGRLGEHPIGAIFEPKTPNTQDGDWYWLMDGIAIDRKVHIFALRMMLHDGPLVGFKVAGISMITLDLDARNPIGEHVQVDTPLFIPFEDPEKDIILGAGIMPNTEIAGAPNPDGYIYVYGLRDGIAVKEMLVARVRPETFADFSTWRYWNGTDWGDDLNAIASITRHVSNELSVTPLPNGEFLAVFQYHGIGHRVAVRVGDTPVGPWGPVIPIWRCPEVDFGNETFAYNAKAHPHLSTEDRILISYNVNTRDFWGDFFDYADIYRPRFLWLHLKP